MSDDKSQQEPSMEDILASIRRILSEDDAEEAAKAPPAPPPAPPPPPPPPPSPPPPPPTPTRAPEPEVMFEPEPEPEPEPVFEPEPEPEPEPVFAPEPEPEPEPEEDILELTDDMVAEDDSYLEEIAPVREPAPRMAMPDLDIAEDTESILAPNVQVASTTALAELARAVARERGVGLGRGGLTLEDLTREILTTLIKDWLDQNLPYMIERIVKKEIEKMVNRAEKL